MRFVALASLVESATATHEGKNWGQVGARRDRLRSRFHEHASSAQLDDQFLFHRSSARGRQQLYRRYPDGARLVEDPERRHGQLEHDHDLVQHCGVGQRQRQWPPKPPQMLTLCSSIMLWIGSGAWLAGLSTVLGL
jgi:hypothetical protein